jgi:N-acetylglucosamine kinase-like BadF-type ATPase
MTDRATRPNGPVNGRAIGRAAVLAVDVGNSKTDVALVEADGSVRGSIRGPSSSHQAVGLERGIRTLVRLVREADGDGEGSSNGPFAAVAALCMAGLDTPRDARRIRDALLRAGIADELVLRNDMDAIIRAGTTSGWGVAVVAGAGMNGLGVAPDGRVVRFGGLGDIAGDWEGVGSAALAAAVRGRDGRGGRTALERVVPGHFGLSRPRDVTLALYRHRIAGARLRELAPVVFATAAAGDEIAAGIVDRLADEIAAFAIAAIRRTSTVRSEVEVVLAGGLIRSGDPRLLARVERLVRAVAPRARIVVLDRPPILGAALIGLDRIAPGGRASADVTARLRSELTEGRFAAD